MSDLSFSLVLNLFLFFALPFVTGYIAVKLRLPAVFGYIVGGIFLGWFLQVGPATKFLPEFATVGIILLLFTVGLELDISKLGRYRKFVVVGGVLQIVFTALVIFLFSLIFQFGFLPSVIIGLAFALSSTAVVAKLIQERGEEYSLLGSLIIGILLFQDLVAIPLMIIFASLTAQTEFFLVMKNVSLGLVKAILVFGLVYFFGKRIVPRVFEKLARTSRELLNLLTIVFIIMAVLVFSFLKLPATVAAFLSGVLIAQTTQHYHIFSQIRPLRDLFAILFFVFLGFQINFATIIFQLPLILLFTVILIVVKLVVVLVIFLFLKFHSRTGFSAGLLLAQVGEFAFIILHQTAGAQLIPAKTYAIALSVVLLSIAATPVLALRCDFIYFRIKQLIKHYLPALFNFLTTLDREPAHMHGLDMINHVVLCGFGRLGRYIGRGLSLVNIPYVAIDYNFHIVDYAKRQAVDIIYGDPTDIDVLDYVQTEKAAALISTLPDKFSQETVILHAKRLNANIKIFARVHEEEHQRRMKDLGAHTVIQPEFEAALSIVKKVLLNFNVPREQIIGKIKRLKLEHGMV